MHPVGAGNSDVGRARVHNEDSFYVDDDRGLYIVADGMGGHASGELASSLAINAVQRSVGGRHAELDLMRELSVDTGLLAEIVRSAVELACSIVHGEAARDEQRKGMGCTLTLLLMVGNKAVMAHVGDTRVYLYRNGAVAQLSTDHTMAAELFMAGLISKEEMPGHQYASILSRAVGTKPTVKVDTLVLEITPGDRFLICSDGLANYVPDDAWLGRQLDLHDAEALVEELVSFANTSGGNDNITAVVVDVRPDEPEVEIVDEMSVDLSHQFLALESVFLFESLSMALHARVLESCRLEEYQDGDVVISEGDPCEQLMVIVDGAFEVLQRGKPEGELGAGEHIGETTLLAPRKSRATLRAKSYGKLLRLERGPFWNLIRSRPWLGVGLLERLGRRLSLDLDRMNEQREDGQEAPAPLEPRERF